MSRRMDREPNPREAVTEDRWGIQSTFEQILTEKLTEGIKTLIKDSRTLEEALEALGTEYHSTVSAKLDPEDSKSQTQLAAILRHYYNEID